MENLKIIHDHILKLQKRADKIDEQALLNTFVQAGPLLPSMESENNQVLFGRRGTGKTHLLQVLRTRVESSAVVAYIDIRTIGSSGSLYNNSSIPVSQRAVSLFKDVLDVIYNEMFEYLLNHEKEYEGVFDELYAELDTLDDYYTQIVISGTVSKGTESQCTQHDSCDVSFGVEGKTIGGRAGLSISSESRSTERTSVEGNAEHYINYNAVNAVLDSVLKKMKVKLWILIDEFSELPSALQLLLADMIHHVFCPNKNIVFKIAAIEYRTFLYEPKERGYIGLELSADVFSENLDDVMVFGNREASALEFFRNLCFNHINNAIPNESRLKDTNEMIQTLFTQENVFNELVYAAEGVPRDAINILCEAVKASYMQKITMPTIRKAAKDWYRRDKYNAVSQYAQASDLLSWIISTVIGNRKAKAFLLRVGHRSKLIDYLFDSRILHILKQNVSGKDSPGERYNVYSIDYGCYVDLMNTKQMVLGLFQEEDDDSAEYVQVPKDDYRSIRRAILDLDLFEKSMQ